MLLAFHTNEPPETAPLTVVELDDLTCYIIGVEDLIIDRLNGYVHWGWEDDRRWVGRLLVLHADTVDWAYLERRAITELIQLGPRHWRWRIAELESSEE